MEVGKNNGLDIFYCFLDFLLDIITEKNLGNQFHLLIQLNRPSINVWDKV